MLPTQRFTKFVAKPVLLITGVALDTTVKNARRTLPMKGRVKKFGECARLIQLRESKIRAGSAATRFRPKYEFGWPDIER